jgi:hypothetical protein
MENFRSIYLYMMFKKKNYYIKKEKTTPPKWVQKGGTNCDDIIFTDGNREIGFEEWLREEYK